MKIRILPNSTVLTVYSDALDLTALGATKITRASHVEPDENGNWTANLTPVSGPVLGPFTKRNTALEEEYRWLTGQLCETILSFHKSRRTQ